MDDSEQKQRNPSLACIAFPGQPLSFILALSSTTFQALLGCSKLNKASFGALGKKSFFLPSLKPVVHSSPRKPPGPYLCCLSLLCTHPAP